MTDPAPTAMPRPAAPPIAALTIVDAPAAVALLCDLRYIETLTAFLGRSRPLGEVAAELGLKLTTLYHRAQRLLDVDLLVVTGHEARAGRSKPLYRACGDAIFMPFRATAFATLDELMEQLQGSREKAFSLDTTAALERIAPAWGVRIERNTTGGGGGNVLLTPSPHGYDPDFEARLLGPDTPAVMNSSGTLRLLPEDAKALQRELLELLQRYQGETTPQGVAHHFRFGLAPMRKHE